MSRHIGCIFLLSLFAGCHSVGPTSHISYLAEVPQVESAQESLQKHDTKVQQVGHVEELETDASAIGLTIGSMASFEQLALDANPAINEIDAEIRSLQGKRTQAGLPPNPVVGINGEEIGDDGSSGRYGIFFGQQVVRGNKLGLSQSVVCAEIEAARRRRDIVVQKVFTDVRQAFFRALIMQKRIETIQQLVELSRQAVDTSEKLVEASEIAATSLLQARLEFQNAAVLLRQAKNRKRAANRQLAALIGESELPVDRLVGEIRSSDGLMEFEESYDQLLVTSPEIAALFADVEQHQRNLQRQIAEPIPDLTWQSTVQFDTLTDNVIAGFQVGMPIPTLNRNQGAIYRAKQEIVSAQHRVDRKTLDLRQRLTDAFQDYVDAQIQVEAFEEEIIPTATQTVDLISEAYRQGETPFLQWLTAQRTYSQTQLTYLDQLQVFWNRHWAVKGLLLNGSLQD